MRLSVIGDDGFDLWLIVSFTPTLSDWNFRH